MDALVQAAIALVLIVVLVLILYLADRIQSLERETREVARSVAARAVPQGVFLGFSGKKLWEAMAAGVNRVPPDIDHDAWMQVRERYHALLPKHIEAIFKEGCKDGEMGLSGEPKNPRTINLVRGPVESWLPPPQVKTIYKCGMDSAQLPPEQWGELRTLLDEAEQFLYSKVGFERERPIVEKLLAPPAAPSETEAEMPADSASAEKETPSALA